MQITSDLTLCLKVIENVSFKIASEASYVYILSEQKFIKNGKKLSTLTNLNNLKIAVKQCFQTRHF